MTKEEFSKIDKFGVGEPNEAFAKYFTGQSFLKPLTDAKKGEIPIFNVTFKAYGKLGKWPDLKNVLWHGIKKP